MAKKNRGHRSKRRRERQEQAEQGDGNGSRQFPESNRREYAGGGDQNHSETVSWWAALWQRVPKRWRTPSVITAMLVFVAGAIYTCTFVLDVRWRWDREDAALLSHGGTRVRLIPSERKAIIETLYINGGPGDVRDLSCQHYYGIRAPSGLYTVVPTSDPDDAGATFDLTPNIPKRLLDTVAPDVYGHAFGPRADSGYSLVHDCTYRTRDGQRQSYRATHRYNRSLNDFESFEERNPVPDRFDDAGCWETWGTWHEQSNGTVARLPDQRYWVSPCRDDQ